MSVSSNPSRQHLIPTSWRRRLSTWIESYLPTESSTGAPWQLVAYRGYANHRRVWLQGRLLSNAPTTSPPTGDWWWENLKASLRRWRTDEVAHAAVTVTYPGCPPQTVSTDADGFYRARFDLGSTWPPASSAVAEYRDAVRVVTGHHWILIPDPRARVLVISDLDDTVIHTGVTNLLRSARLTFLTDATARKPLCGVGELYRWLVRGPKGGQPINPIAYVSNAPWNLYELLRDFLDHNELPRGPLLLRDFTLTAALRKHQIEHKTEALRTLLRRYPALPVVLIGDSGQHDAAIYARIADEHPGRVKAIYIRDIDPSHDSQYDARVDDLITRHAHVKVPFVRVSDSAEIASHAVDLGLLAPAALPEVRRAVWADRQYPALGERLAPSTR